GTVNRLLGGIDSAAVGPDGSVYYVFGIRDLTTNENRLEMTRLTPNATGGLTLNAPTFVTGQVQAALPSVAVNGTGTVGVMYDTFDGFNGSGFPIFSVHLARSTDQGGTFTDTTVNTFSSPSQNNPN